ncbi:predicted protein [Arabidopsis lyrata subsp. lyrata]|uniref:Predicted protein n=1 Tax=Arabidopsis lyrata subsp. lyrata TaxID=81972 RepID=D7MIB4_ARALL|nr:predicted protein [Arabidopsis lyrata subsp. lyrata]
MKWDVKELCAEYKKECKIGHYKSYEYKNGCQGGGLARDVDIQRGCFTAVRHKYVPVGEGVMVSYFNWDDKKRGTQTLSYSQDSSRGLQNSVVLTSGTVNALEDAHKKRGNEFSGASSSRCGWLVFDRGNKNRISGDVMNIVFSVLDLKKCFLQGGCSENKKRGNAFRVALQDGLLKNSITFSWPKLPKLSSCYTLDLIQYKTKLKFGFKVLLSTFERVSKKLKDCKTHEASRAKVKLSQRAFPRIVATDSTFNFFPP